MVDRIWLKNYPPGVPAEIDPDRFTSIGDLFDKTATAFSGRPAYHNLGHTLSYADLERLSRDFAAFLQALPAMGKGERVAIMSPNLLQYPVALFGILRAGMTVVNVNPLYTPRELEHQLKDAGARAIVIVENCAHALQQVLPNTPVEHVITTQVGDLLPTWKRWILNFVVKRAKRMVPAWCIERAVSFRAALARGTKSPLRAVDVTAGDIAFL
ncbi:MAG: AMP-binding protein, partial [Casimicrobiaceae bacterium]